MTYHGQAFARPAVAEEGLSLERGDILLKNTSEPRMLHHRPGHVGGPVLLRHATIPVVGLDGVGIGMPLRNKYFGQSFINSQNLGLTPYAKTSS